MREKTNKKVYNLCLIALAAAFITVCAWIYIPFPIAVTLQTFGICTVCGILGLKRGFLSVLIYVCLGLVGLPVFSGFRSGIAALTDQSGGFVVGFLLLALTVGAASKLFGGKTSILVGSMIIGMLLCYFCGVLWYYLLYANGASLASVISVCVLPFLIPDAIKIALAAIVIRCINRSAGKKNFFRH